MKFLLVEDSKFKMGNLLQDLLKSYMKDTTQKYRGQTELKKYLCENRGVQYSDDLDVHHIDANHENYKDDNLALLEHNDHKQLHKKCMNDVLKEIRDEVYEYGPGYIELEDLHPDIQNIVRKRYIELLKENVVKIRKG